MTKINAGKLKTILLRILEKTAGGLNIIPLVEECFEEEKWEPSENEIFFYINPVGEVIESSEVEYTEGWKIPPNSCFKTKQEALTHKQSLINSQ